MVAQLLGLKRPDNFSRVNNFSRVFILNTIDVEKGFLEWVYLCLAEKCKY